MLDLGSQFVLHVLILRKLPECIVEYSRNGFMSRDDDSADMIEQLVICCTIIAVDFLVLTDEYRQYVAPFGGFLALNKFSSQPLQ